MPPSFRCRDGGRKRKPTAKNPRVWFLVWTQLKAGGFSVAGSFFRPRRLRALPIDRPLHPGARAFLSCSPVGSRLGLF
jgi:hypothetical protein